MNIYGPKEIKPIITSAFRNQALVPIIGSGVSCSLPAYRGQIPNGKSYKEHMLCTLINSGQFSEEEKEELRRCSFSSLCSYYEDSRIVNESIRFSYLKNNFYQTRYTERDIRRSLFDIDWPYIYSLNIDDSVENSSSYNTVIVPYRDTREDIFTNAKCLIKLHGDIQDIIKYKYSEKVFTAKEYALSIEKNAPILTKLQNDFCYQNVLYIGCSLDDEIDMMTVSSFSSRKEITKKNLSHIIFFTKGRPGILVQSKLRSYGVTDIVCFDDYDSMYSFLFDTWQEAMSIQTSELSQYCNLITSSIDSKDKKNLDYFFWGKGLFEDTTKKISYPYYFISRATTTNIISRLHKHKLHLVSGGHVSGKTYLMADLYRTIKDRDVYYFDGRTRVTNEAIDYLLSLNNSVFLFDVEALNRSQFETIVINASVINRNYNNCVIAISRNDGDSFGIIKWKVREGLINSNDIIRYELNNKFENTKNGNEIDSINKLLPTINLPVYSPKRTILDQLIYTEKQLDVKSKYSQRHISVKSYKQLALLIILAIKERLSSLEAIRFSLENEVFEAVKKYTPFIESIDTVTFEKDAEDLSSVKYIVNSKYWIQRELGNYARNESNYSLISDAYTFIIKKVLSFSANEFEQRRYYRDYILFDVMNDIFLDEHRGNLKLIMYIYEKLHNVLSYDYNFLHQKAKCCLNCAYSIKDRKNKEKYLRDARELSIVALSMIEKRFDETGNEYLLISLAHVWYTIATIDSEYSYLESFSDITLLKKTIDSINKALLSPYNQEDYKRELKRRSSTGIVRFLKSVVIIKQSGIEQSYINQLEKLINYG